MVIVLAVIIWIRMRRMASVKGSQWTQNPRFGHMYSQTQVAAGRGVPKSSLAPSNFNAGGREYSSYLGLRALAVLFGLSTSDAMLYCSFIVRILIHRLPNIPNGYH